MRHAVILAGILFAQAMMVASTAVHAADKPATLDELLDRTAAERAAAVALASEREATFNQAQAAEQDQLMKDALAARAAASEASKALLERYGATELKIGEQNARLKEQLATLGLAEVFGLARQAAGDAATVLGQSLTTAQIAKSGEIADRGTFLRNLAASKQTPAQSDLERLWTELLGEMTLSGKVARYTSRVVQPDGNTADAEVVAVGPFTATAGGDYLAYQPELQSLIRYARQPPAELREMAERLAAASTGYAPAAVDPTRGVLLAMYVERPSWLDRIRKGEEVGYIIIAVGLLALLLWAVQFLYLLVVRISVWRQLRNLAQPSRSNPLGRVLLAFKGKPEHIEEDADIAELRISEAVMREVPALERFQAFLRLAVAAGPLLGLIGTVVGMIMTFQAITESGSSDPKLMADGIGQAMIATVLGLGIAIPLLFANAMLATLSRAVVQILDEQSAGLLAESLEQRRRA